MADKQLMERAEQALYKVYNRFPVVFDHGEGVKLYDTEGIWISVLALRSWRWDMGMRSIQRPWRNSFTS